MATTVWGPPKLGGRVYFTDGGLETTLSFQDGVDPVRSAAFALLVSDEGRERLEAYYRSYLAVAAAARAGFILEAPTGRASRDWGARLGYGADALHDINCEAIGLLNEIREAAARPQDIVVSGRIGPRGGGGVVSERMSADAAADYHRAQVLSFRAAGADMVVALTLVDPEEAIGVARAARDAAIPVAISFTTDTDGRLPCGDEIGSAVAAVDAATGAYPAYFMIDCAHPDHFSDALDPDAPWAGRLGGVRANASRLSRAERDAAEAPDDGDPAEFGALCLELRQAFPQITVFGGCCGTDQRHIGEAAKAMARAGLLGVEPDRPPLRVE